MWVMKMNLRDELQCFCENIRQLRKEKKLSRYAMAKKLKIGVVTLRKIEQGIIPPRLSCKILLTIFDEFHIEPAKMFSPLHFSFPEKNQKKQKNS